MTELDGAPTSEAGQAHPELGFYTLAGAPASNRELLTEVAQAARDGFGTAFVSERFNVKEAAVQCGAAAAMAGTMRVATGVTNHNTRHPIVTASFGLTMHEMTDGRFTLGLGRGIPMLQDVYGLGRITSSELEAMAGVLRRLFAGEMVPGADAPGSDGGLLFLGSEPVEIPLLLSAFGPRTLELGGRVFDEVLLHTFFTDETTRRCVDTVRTAAEQAGRDPASVKVWSCLATIGDHLPEPLRLKKTVGRLATYLQGYGDLLVKTNAWDPTALDRFRADAVVASIAGAIDQTATTAQLEHIATLLPDEWLEPSATGSPASCARAIAGQFDLGCDAVILHGASPEQLRPVLAAYRTNRPA